MAATADPLEQFAACLSIAGRFGLDAAESCTEQQGEGQ
jgi:hypothetical protein